MICENEIPISMHQTGETETFADTAPKLSNCDDSLSFSRLVCTACKYLHCSEEVRHKFPFFTVEPSKLE